MIKSIKEIVNSVDKVFHKKLKISIGGFSISENGNITLQTWKKDRRLQITLHNEMGIKEEQLESMLDKVYYINDIIVSSKFDKEKNKEIKGQESYFGVFNKENLKEVGKYDGDSLENGLFDVLFDSDDILPITKVEEVEISEWVNGKPQKIKSLSFTTLSRVKGKVIKRVYLTELSNKVQLQSLKGKKVQVLDIYTTGSGNFKKYHTDILPRVSN